MCLESCQCCGQSAETDHNKLPYQQFIRSCQHPHFDRISWSCYSANWWVRTVFLCCYACLYNYNPSDVLQIKEKVLTFLFECSDIKCVLLQVTNAGTEMFEVDTCVETKNQQLFWIWFGLQFCAHITIIHNWMTCIILLPKLSSQNLDIRTKIS
jgi:hypothetical protein